MEKNPKFNLAFVKENFKKINSVYQRQKQIPINEFCIILDEFCVLFAQMSSVLGVAFSDVTQKSTIIRNNYKLFPQHHGFFSFVQMEMSKNIHIYNGDNNKSKKAPEQWKKYNSTSRNLLRMMWFFSFLRSTFEQLRDKPVKTKLAEILDEAYDVAFGDKHSWLVRKAAKIAIATGSDRKRLVECVLGSYDQERLKVQNLQFLKQLTPVHQALWGFYKKNNLTDLE